MSSALTASHLPPTTNTLNSQQRVRLMRSTRKLGAVLGTTPYLLESDTSFAILPLGKTTTTRSLKRQGSIFTHHQHSSLSVISSTSTTLSHHPSSSTSSTSLHQTPHSLPVNPPGLSAARAHRTGDKVAKLFLRLNAAPASTDNPLSPLLPPTPCTPIPPPLNLAEIRRKRMAKLARHLGEIIPAELVSTSQSAPKPAPISPDPPALRRSQSIGVMSPQVASTPDNRPPLGQSRQDWTGEWNRSNINVVRKELRNLKAR